MVGAVEAVVGVVDANNLTVWLLEQLNQNHQRKVHVNEEAQEETTALNRNDPQAGDPRRNSRRRSLLSRERNDLRWDMWEDLSVLSRRWALHRKSY